MLDSGLRGMSRILVPAWTLSWLAVPTIFPVTLKCIENPYTFTYTFTHTLTLHIHPYTNKSAILIIDYIYIYNIYKIYIYILLYFYKMLCYVKFWDFCCSLFWNVKRETGLMYPKPTHSIFLFTKSCATKYTALRSVWMCTRCIHAKLMKRI